LLEIRCGVLEDERQEDLASLADIKNRFRAKEKGI
jgi:hypothetical protein